MKSCLLSAPASGAFWLIFLFIVCFFGVHTVRLAKLGWKYRKEGTEKKSAPPPSRREQEPPPPPPAERKESPQQPEPVYYIVERKRRKSRDSYSEPKEIKFK